MSTDRDFDIWMVEIQAENDKMEMEWQLDKLGSRAKRMMANANRYRDGREEEADTGSRPAGPASGQ